MLNAINIYWNGTLLFLHTGCFTFSHPWGSSRRAHYVVGQCKFGWGLLVEAWEASFLKGSGFEIRNVKASLKTREARVVGVNLTRSQMQLEEMTSHAFTQAHCITDCNLPLVMGQVHCSNTSITARINVELLEVTSLPYFHYSIIPTCHQVLPIAAQEDSLTKE